jgi:hypothetical protein
MNMKYLGPLIAFIIALALAFILILLSHDPSGGEAIPPLQHSDYDKRLDRLDRKGIEAAYVTRVGLLYTNWMTDTNQASQERALKGHRNAREIYIKVMTALDAREPEEGYKVQSDTSTPVILPAR